jgi:hypothetical protein
MAYGPLVVKGEGVDVEEHLGLAGTDADAVRGFQSSQVGADAGQRHQRLDPGDLETTAFDLDQAGHEAEPQVAVTVLDAGVDRHLVAGETVGAVDHERRRGREANQPAVGADPRLSGATGQHTPHHVVREPGGAGMVVQVPPVPDVQTVTVGADPQAVLVVEDQVPAPPDAGGEVRHLEVVAEQLQRTGVGGHPHLAVSTGDDLPDEVDGHTVRRPVPRRASVGHGDGAGGGAEPQGAVGVLGDGEDGADGPAVGLGEAPRPTARLEAQAPLERRAQPQAVVAGPVQRAHPAADEVDPGDVDGLEAVSDATGHAAVTGGEQTEARIVEQAPHHPVRKPVADVERSNRGEGDLVEAGDGAHPHHAFPISGHRQDALPVEPGRVVHGAPPEAVQGLQEALVSPCPDRFLRRQQRPDRVDLEHSFSSAVAHPVYAVAGTEHQLALPLGDDEHLGGPVAHTEGFEAPVVELVEIVGGGEDQCPRGQPCRSAGQTAVAVGQQGLQDPVAHQVIGAGGRDQQGVAEVSDPGDAFPRRRAASRRDLQRGRDRAHALGGGDEQVAVRGGHQVPDLVGRESVSSGQDAKRPAVVAGQPALRAHPQIAAFILGEGLHLALGQAVGVRVVHDRELVTQRHRPDRHETGQHDDGARFRSRYGAPLRRHCSSLPRRHRRPPSAAGRQPPGRDHAARSRRFIPEPEPVALTVAEVSGSGQRSTVPTMSAWYR